MIFAVFEVFEYFFMIFFCFFVAIMCPYKKNHLSLPSILEVLSFVQCRRVCVASGERQLTPSREEQSLSGYSLTMRAMGGKENHYFM